MGAVTNPTTALQVVCLPDLIGARIIRKRLLLYAIVTILTISFTQPLIRASKTESSPIKNPDTVQASKVELKNIIEKPKVAPIATSPAPKGMAQQPQAKAAAATPQTPPTSGSCDEAISNVWPATLQSGARLVSLKEASLKPDQIGPIRADGSIGYNYDGSRDYGCFQINDKAHPDFFAGGDWRNPTYNAQYALKIYNERGNWTAWYAVRGILW